MKTMLSMPSTISRSVRVKRPSQALGLVSSSIDPRIPWVGRRTSYHGATVTDAPVTTRRLPMLDVLDVAPAAPTAPRSPGGAAGRPPDRVPARRPGPAAVPRLDARLPDEPQRLRGDGRTPAGLRLRGGRVDGRRRPHRHQHVRHPRRRRTEGHRPPGPAGAAQGRESRAPRRPDRLFGPRAGPGRASVGAIRRWTCSCAPTRSPSSSIASAWPPPRRRSEPAARRPSWDGPSSASRTIWRGPVPPRWGRGASRARAR